MGDISELTIDAIYKNPVISKIFLKKILKLGSYHLVIGFGVVFILILLPNHRFAEKQGGKRDLVGLDGPSSFKIVFTLLAKTIAVKV